VYRNGNGDVTFDGAEIKAAGMTANTTRVVWIANASAAGAGKVYLKGSAKITTSATATANTVLGIYIAYFGANARVVVDNTFTPSGTYRLARSGGETANGVIRVEGGAPHASYFSFGGSGLPVLDLSIRGEDLVNTTVSSITMTTPPTTEPFDADDELTLADLDDMVVTATYAAPADTTAVVNHAYLTFTPPLPYTFTTADTASTTKEFTVTFGTRTATFTVNLKQPEEQPVNITIDFGLSDPDSIAIDPFTLKFGVTDTALRQKTLTVTGNYTVKWFIDGTDVSNEATDGGKTLVLDADDLANDFDKIGTYTLRVEASTIIGIKPVIYSKTITFTVTL
jgi:hypothetical protein